ncbi:DUF1501 domain-containing protein [Photobacterium lutimaris]|uniref:DUF1501 domain-containing protein n=1 Tax=Photobacterium lutimaris TaxID=388278 RepID=A0A2T3J1A6_9GAMM|nr:DUF1501 domain-containing protein [Photobacterium lutimaris]PSU34861.1 hypothetical protein C9I99_07190 [Photobacterium lutimaris]TDR77203.1 secreted protein [Photobacterium lutimaris]
MKISRRHFLKSSTALGALSALPGLSLSKQAVAGDDEFKALVCIFLFGGNDAFNMVVPIDGEYDKYEKARPTLAIEKRDLIDIGIQSEAGDNRPAVNLGLHPAMARLESVFRDNNATVIVNSGQLVGPIIGETNPYPVPDFLMAHNLQQTMWQSGALNMDDKLGWAGRMVESVYMSNDLSPMMSLNGEQKWLRNDMYEQMVMTGGGAGKYNGLDQHERYEAMTYHFDRQFNNLFKDNYADVMSSRYYQNERLAELLGEEDDDSVRTSLGEQLHTTAKLIEKHAEMGHHRQVYFVGLGGFDTHHNQKNVHHALLEQLSDAMADFYQALKDIQMLDKVTTFTMSDFGRRLMANDTGTDHGWAGHQLVMGGSVNGGKAYGKWPDLTPGSKYDYNNGRLIPEIAADQVNATLANWFGYTGNLTDLFPSLDPFPIKTIDFLS